MGKRAGAGREEASWLDLQFEFHAPDFHAPADVVEYAHAKLVSKLSKHRRRVQAVTVWVRDTNGPRGAPALVCHLQAHLSGLEPVIIEEREADLRAVLDVAIDALDLAVQRHIERARTKPRNAGRKIVRHRKLTPTGT